MSNFIFYLTGMLQEVFFLSTENPILVNLYYQIHVLRHHNKIRFVFSWGCILFLFQALNLEDLLFKPTYATNAQRVENRESLVMILQERCG